MAIFNSYVKLPEGTFATTYGFPWFSHHVKTTQAFYTACVCCSCRLGRHDLVQAASTYAQTMYNLFTSPKCLGDAIEEPQYATRRYKKTANFLTNLFY
jgi:hypothetical protein